MGPFYSSHCYVSVVYCLRASFQFDNDWTNGPTDGRTEDEDDDDGLDDGWTLDDSSISNYYVYNHYYHFRFDISDV